MKIICTVDSAELDGDYDTVPRVTAECARCGHETESYGDGAASVRRCLVLMREECPRGESNYYTQE